MTQRILCCNSIVPQRNGYVLRVSQHNQFIRIRRGEGILSSSHWDFQHVLYLAERTEDYGLWLSRTIVSTAVQKILPTMLSKKASFRIWRDWYSTSWTRENPTLSLCRWAYTGTVLRNIQKTMSKTAFVSQLSLVGSLLFVDMSPMVLSRLMIYTFRHCLFEQCP